MKMWLAQAGQTGRLVEAASAHISAMDRGVTVGAGVFETLKVASGRVFALSDHLDRLRRSAQQVGVPVPADTAIITGITELVQEQGSIPFGRIRITLTQGVGDLSDPYSGESEPTLIITCTAQQPWPATSTVHFTHYTRNPTGALAGVKSTSYAENAIALRQAKQSGADEALFFNTRGEVCEGTGSNIVIAVDGKLLTPPLESGCLAGITRAFTLQYCGVREQTLTRGDLERATEAFLTSSTRDVHPISVLGDRTLPAPGPLTRQAIDDWKLMEQNPEHWFDPHGTKSTTSSDSRATVTL